jgi:hypothetical protein
VRADRSVTVTALKCQRPGGTPAGRAGGCQRPGRAQPPGPGSDSIFKFRSASRVTGTEPKFKKRLALATTVTEAVWPLRPAQMTRNGPGRSSRKPQFQLEVQVQMN